MVYTNLIYITCKNSVMEMDTGYTSPARLELETLKLGILQILVQLNYKRLEYIHTFYIILNLTFM